MKQKIFLGIDTSNYTTSCAIATENGEILHNFKILLPVSEGERGLRQSDAVFAHIKNIMLIAEKIKSECSDFDIVAIGYSAFPRDVEGSYMPCFLVGEAVAKMLASVLKIETYAFSHQSGHIRAVIYSSNVSVGNSFISFHVSGGTTEVLLVEKNNCYYKMNQIGGSVDLHAGQAIDRIGVSIGFKFPCGKEMEGLAFENTDIVPSPKICVNGFECNLSGLENLAIQLYAKTSNKPLVCAYTFEFIGRTLEKITENLRIKYGNLPIVYAGGVMSNTIIKNRLLGRFENVFFASPEFSTDNASGIALLAKEKHFCKEV